MVDRNGNIATYVYDGVGNLISITRSTASSGTLAIFNVIPLQGEVGQQVAIQGQGFSTTAANNAISFNGVAAIVTSATSTNLVTTVPAAAATGPVSVTVGGVTAQGPTFTVLPRLAITPSNPSIPLGKTQQFKAVNLFSDGTTQDLTTPPSWSSSNFAVATINNSSPNGLATSTGIGATTVTASADLRTASTILTVTPPVPISLDVAPANVSVSLGLTVQYGAVLTFTDGSTQDATTTATWGSSNTAVAKISNASGSQGLATTLGIGSSMITATSSALTASTKLTVTSASQALPRFAYVPNSDGTLSIYVINEILGVPVSYAISAPQQTVAIDPTQKFLYVGNTFVGQLANITEYVIDSSAGVLAPLSGSPLQLGTAAAQGISIHPAGKLLYASGGNCTAPLILGIDQGTGVLSPLGGTGVSCDGVSTTFDPSGKFLYMPMGSQSNSVAGFTVDGTTGLLTKISGSPFPAGNNPNYLVVDSAGKFAYAINLNSNDISAYTLDPTSGNLISVTGSPFATGSFPVAAAVDPLSRFLFVSDATFSASLGGFTGTISAYEIDPNTGALTSVPGSPFAPPDAISATTGDLVVDPASRFLYVTDNSAGVLHQFSIDPTTGALGFLKSFEGRGEPLSMTISKGTASPSYIPRLAFAVNSASNNISGYSIDPASGALTPLSGSPFGAGSQPSSVVVHPAGKFAYALNAADQTILAYSLDPSTGALTQIGSPIVEGQTGENAAMIDPSGQYLYVLNTSAPGSFGSVSAYQINAVSGALTVIPGSPFATGSASSGTGTGVNPVSMTMDPQGKSLVVTDSGSNDVSVFRIVLPGASQPAGGLVLGSNASTGARPLSVAVGPTLTDPKTHRPFSVIYVANSGSGNISTFLLPMLAGGLSSPGTAPLAVGPNLQSVVVEPNNKYLYVVGGSSGAAGSVWGFSIDPTSGALAAVPGSPFTAGANPTSITVDITGQFVYVVNSGSNDVSVFRISPVTGALNTVAGSPFAAGTTPRAITTYGVIH